MNAGPPPHRGARRRVVLVVDTGVDDALALLVAVRHPAVDLHAVVVTAGNVALPAAAANTAYVLAVLQARVPVGRGAARRRDGSAFPARPQHGPYGLGPLGPTAAVGTDSLPPAEAVVPQGALLVSLGPLSTVARLVATPWTGDVLASCAGAGEANAVMDLLAVEEVRRAGLPLRVDGGEAFSAPRPAPAVAQAMARHPDPVTRLAGVLLAHQAGRGASVGDAGTLLRLVEPGLDPAGQVDRLVALAGGGPGGSG